MSSGLKRALAALLLVMAPIACGDESTRLNEHLARGESHLEQARYAEAAIEFRSALQLDPNHAGAHYGLARSYLAVENMREGYWELLETVRLDGTRVEARLQLGDMALRGGNLAEAMAQARAILEIDPEHARATLLQARVFDYARRPYEAKVAYEKARDLAPDDPLALRLLADFYRRIGARGAAEPVLRRVVEVEPGFEAYSTLAGFLAEDRSRDDEAERAYREALAHAGSDERVAAYRTLASFYHSRDREEEVEATLLEALDRHPEDLDLIYLIARFYQDRGDTRRADELIESAIRAPHTGVSPALLLSLFRAGLGDVEGALQAVEKALELDPDDTTARLRKAELLIDLGESGGDAARIDEALAIADAVLADQPGHATALFVRAKAAIVNGEPEKATVDLRRVLERRPAWAHARFLLGTSLFLSGDLPLARRELTRALELDAQLAPARRLLMQTHAALGDDELAVEEGMRVLRSEPADVRIRVQVAQSLARLGRPTDGLQLLEAISDEEQTVASLYAIGRLRGLAGDLEGARMQLLLANQRDPYDLDVLRELLDLEQRSGHLDESMQRLDRAVEARPDDSMLVNLQGVGLMLSGRDDAAESAFRRAIALDPGNLAPYRLLASRLSAAGRVEEAIELCQAAVEARPDSAAAHLTLGSIYLEQGRLGPAAASFDKAVALDPTPSAKNHLAYTLAEKGEDLDRALLLAQEAKLLEPDDPNTADTLGWVLYKMGRASSAIAYLKEAERGLDSADPDLGTVRYHLALAYEASGEEQKARDVLEQVLADLEARRATRAERGEGERADPAWAADLQAVLDRLPPPVANETSG